MNIDRDGVAVGPNNHSDTDPGTEVNIISKDNVASPYDLIKGLHDTADTTPPPRSPAIPRHLASQTETPAVCTVIDISENETEENNPADLLRRSVSDTSRADAAENKVSVSNGPDENPACSERREGSAADAAENQVSVSNGPDENPASSEGSFPGLDIHIPIVFECTSSSEELPGSVAELPGSFPGSVAELPAFNLKLCYNSPISSPVDVTTPINVTHSVEPPLITPPQMTDTCMSGCVGGTMTSSHYPDILKYEDETTRKIKTEMSDFKPILDPTDDISLKLEEALESVFESAAHLLETDQIHTLFPNPNLEKFRKHMTPKPLLPEAASSHVRRKPRLLEHVPAFLPKKQRKETAGQGSNSGDASNPGNFPNNGPDLHSKQSLQQSSKRQKTNVSESNGCWNDIFRYSASIVGSVSNITDTINSLQSGVPISRIATELTAPNINLNPASSIPQASYNNATQPSKRRKTISRKPSGQIPSDVANKHDPDSQISAVTVISNQEETSPQSISPQRLSNLEETSPQKLTILPLLEPVPGNITPRKKHTAARQIITVGRSPNSLDKISRRTQVPDGTMSFASPEPGPYPIPATIIVNNNVKRKLAHETGKWGMENMAQSLPEVQGIPCDPAHLDNTSKSNVGILESNPQVIVRKAEILEDIKMEGDDIPLLAWYQRHRPLEKKLKKPIEIIPKRERFEHFDDRESILIDWYKQTVSAGIEVTFSMLMNMVKSRYPELANERRLKEFIEKLQVKWMRNNKMGFFIKHIPDSLSSQAEEVRGKGSGSEHCVKEKCPDVVPDHPLLLWYMECSFSGIPVTFSTLLNMAKSRYPELANETKLKEFIENHSLKLVAETSLPKDRETNSERTGECAASEPHVASP